MNNEFPYLWMSNIYSNALVFLEKLVLVVRNKWTTSSDRALQTNAGVKSKPRKAHHNNVKKATNSKNHHRIDHKNIECKCNNNNSNSTTNDNDDGCTYHSVRASCSVHIQKQPAISFSAHRHPLMIPHTHPRICVQQHTSIQYAAILQCFGGNLLLHV